MLRLIGNRRARGEATTHEGTFEQVVASSNLIIFRDSNTDPLKDRSGKGSQGLLHHQQTACTGGGYGIIITATIICDVHPS